MIRNRSFPAGVLQALLLAALSTPTPAAIIVDWSSSDYVTTGQVWSNPTTYGDITVLRNPAEGYNVVSGKSYNFYGGIEVSSGTAEARITNVASGLDYMAFKTTGGTSPVTVSGLVLFKQADFLNGGNGEGAVVSLAGTDQFSAALRNYQWSGTPNTFRWVIQTDANQYYASGETNFTNTLTTYTADVSSLHWYAYTPASGIHLADQGTAQTPSLSSIWAVGVYLTGTRTNTANNLGVESIVITATVPEPSVCAMLCGGLTWISIVLRRRGKAVAA